MLALPISSYLTRNMDMTKQLNITWGIKLLRGLSFVSGICTLSFFLKCDDKQFQYAGGNRNWKDINSISSTWDSISNSSFEGFNPQLHGTCSADDRSCPCSTEDFAPICANLTFPEDPLKWEDITFFSPCHLGCDFSPSTRSSIMKRSGDEFLKDCKCLSDDSTFSITFGPCASYSCDWRIFIIIPGLVISCFLTFFQVVPDCWSQMPLSRTIWEQLHWAWMLWFIDSLEQFRFP